MNALTKFALVITSIALPLTANAKLASDIQDSTTVSKSDVVKWVDQEMKLSALELVKDVTVVKSTFIAPAAPLFVLNDVSYTKMGSRIAISKP